MANNNGAALTDGQEMLIKTIDESSGGSITTEYKYDSNGKILSEYTTMTNSSVGTRTSSIFFYRDGSGRIFKTAQKYDQPVEHILYDTIITLVVYENGTSNRIKFSKTETTANGITVYDSVLYSYSTAGKVVKTQHYLYRSTDMPGTLPRQVNWFSWEYSDAGNLLRMQQYSDHAGNGNFELDISYTFEYDNKVNPYYSGDDIRLEADWYSASPNNVIKQTVLISQTKEQYDNLISYDQYDVKGRPKTATHTPRFAPVIHTKFFYQ